MRKEITRNQLYLIDDDIRTLTRRHIGVTFLLQSRIDAFYAKNKRELRTLNDRLYEIQKRFIEYDKENKPITIPAAEGKEQDWQYLESATDRKGKFVTGEDVGKAYKEEAEDFLGRLVYVEL